jgi:MoaA/NifB/PqqE/SkfB family radical SAM enzyme
MVITHGLIHDNKKRKVLRSPHVNYIFDKASGFMATWGKTKEQDPDYSDVGPFILDIEITERCAGVGPNKELCNYCYKSNTHEGHNLSLQDFKTILDKVNYNGQLTQIALGLGAAATENPDIWAMCEYTRSKGIIPNGTVADISPTTAFNINKYFGACAVSIHGNKNVAYNSIHELAQLEGTGNLKQINIHHVIFQENLKETYEILQDIKTDPRLKKLNAIVLLSLKNKGRAENLYTPLQQSDFTKLVQHLLKEKISFGFDSCGAQKFINSIQNHPDKTNLTMLAEPCESSCFSSYVNCHGIYFPCSFAENNNKNWEVNLLEHDLKTIWNNNPFRQMLLNNGRNCPLYKV